MSRINPPFPPSTPERAPWDEVLEITRRQDRVITLLSQMVSQLTGAPLVAGAPMAGMVGVPGVLPITTERMTSLFMSMAPEVLGSSAILPFRKTVSAATQDEQERQVPFTGILRDVIMAFPAGCQQLVEVRLIYFSKGGSRDYVVPTVEDSFIALDDFTVAFQPRFPVEAPGQLRVEWWNYDSLNSHSVPVIITVFRSPLGVPVG